MKQRNHHVTNVKKNLTKLYLSHDQHQIDRTLYTLSTFRNSNAASFISFRNLRIHQNLEELGINFAEDIGKLGTDSISKLQNEGENC